MDDIGQLGLWSENNIPSASNDSAQKQCSVCEEIKLISDFYENHNCADGRANQCKECVKQRARNRDAAERTNRPDPYNETGKVYGAWTVVREALRPPDKKEQGRWWLCRCICNRSEQIMPGSRLRAGRFSAGCDLCCARGHATTGKMSPEYQTWRGMRERCLRPDSDSYKYYGARGITICERWIDNFAHFLADMGPRPKGMTLDRIDNDGIYAPENCRWANARTQSQNSRHCKLTDEQIEAIRRVLKWGVIAADIAIIAGVSRSHIANIATGHSRKT